MSRQVFYDPERKRWKRLRRVLDLAAVASTFLLVAFFLGVIHREQLPDLLLPAQKRNYKAVKANQAAEARRAALGLEISLQTPSANIPHRFRRRH